MSLINRTGLAIMLLGIFMLVLGLYANANNRFALYFGVFDMLLGGILLILGRK